MSDARTPPTATTGPPTVLALDLGGTRLKSGVVTAEGAVVDFSATRLDGRPALAVVIDTAVALQARHPVGAVGLAVPGLVDGGRLAALAGKLPGLEGVDLVRALQDHLALPAAVANDAQAYALGESRFGAARGAGRAVVVTIGTGVGVAVVEDGRPLGRGPHGAGILGGHIPIAHDSPLADSNGRHGTIEALCAANAIVDGADGAFDTVEATLVAARLGRMAALRAVGGWRENVVQALVALAHAHGPDVIVVGGGPLSADAFLLEGVEEAVNHRLYRGYSVRVRAAMLGDTAALVGMAALAGAATGVPKG